MTELWTWAVQAYAEPAVAETCLSLQDENDQNVPLLLFAAWAAASGRALDPETLEAAVDLARAWDGAAVRPLRAVRRTLKTPLPDLDDARRQALRERIKAAELEAERLLLESLAELAPAASGPPRPLAAALAEAARAWTRVVPRAGLERLAAALPA